MKNLVIKWIVSILLGIISLGGLLSFPTILSSAHNSSQYLVATAHLIYVLSGFAIIYGIWKSVRSTQLIVVIWGIASLGAALGGPLVYASATTTFYRAAILMSITIGILTFALLWYIRRIRAEIN